MARTGTVLQVFVASPGDVEAERASVAHMADEWNNVWSEFLGIRIEVLRWETHSYPDAGNDAQDVINRQLGTEYDIFIGVMGSRVGTPTARAASGTLEEFSRALSSFRLTKSPRLMFYFKHQPPSQTANDQFARVREFQEKLKSDGLLFWLFDTTEQFEKLIRIHLIRQVQAWTRRNGVELHRQASPPRPISSPAGDDPYAFLTLAGVQLTIMTSLTDRLMNEQKSVADDFEERTAEMAQASASGPTGLFRLKAAFAGLASDLNTYSDVMEALLRLYEQASARHLEALLTFVTLSLKTGRGVPSETAGLLTSLVASTASFSESTAKFASVFAGVPSVTDEGRVASERAFHVTERLAAKMAFEANALSELLTLTKDGH